VGADDRTTPRPGEPNRDAYRYPLVATDLREWEGALAPEIYLWDIDNTYLITRLESWRDLIRLRFESAADKRPVPGAPELLRALRRGLDGERAPRRGIYFVSASPEAMRETLERRMLIDRIEFDGATFRDLWAHRKPHLRHIRDIYGYKMAALLSYRLAHPAQARELLFGDDREHDPEVYALYARVCAGHIGGGELDGILEQRAVLRKDRDYIVGLADRLPAFDPVDAIFIRRLGGELRGPEAPFDVADARVRVVSDYFELALWLFAKGKVAFAALEQVAEAVCPSLPAGSLGASVARVFEDGAPLSSEQRRQIEGLVERTVKRVPVDSASAGGPVRGDEAEQNPSGEPVRGDEAEQSPCDAPTPTDS
jgi:hypothetical protein